MISKTELFAIKEQFKSELDQICRRFEIDKSDKSVLMLAHDYALYMSAQKLIVALEQIITDK